MNFILVVLLFPLVTFSFSCAHKGHSKRRDDVFTKVVNKVKKERKKCPNPGACKVKLLADEKLEHCVNQRQQDLRRSRYWYQITDSETTPAQTEFPLRKDVPFLRQPFQKVGFYYAVDKDEGRYLLLFKTWKTVIEGISDKLNATFHKIPTTEFSNHKTIYKEQQNAIKKYRVPQYFGSPPEKAEFTDHIANDEWRTDEAFVQRRLAGQCPFMLQKVTNDGTVGYNMNDLTALLNPDVFTSDFRFDRGNGEMCTLKKAVKKGWLYVLHNKVLDDFKTAEDITDTNPDDDRVLRKLSSPISLYFLKEDGMLGVAAIQWNSKPDSKVHLPKADSLDWEIAKSQVEVASGTTCQATYHLGGIHFSSTIFCLSYRRHLSTYHPLYDVMKYHCEGTVPHISLAYPFLTQEGGPGDQYFAIGNTGFAALSLGEFKKRTYGHYDYDALIKGRGLDDKAIKYYPFREDSILIWKELERFAKKFVQIYYGKKKQGKPTKTFPKNAFKNDDTDGDDDEDDEDSGLKAFDNLKNEGSNDQEDDLDLNPAVNGEVNENIKRDTELQAYVNELSAEGSVAPDGGKGKFPGFPAKFEKKEDLVLFLVRFLWYNVVHSVVNYPLAPEFVPIQVGKTYTRKNGEIQDLIELYPGYNEPEDAVYNVGKRGILSNFRANRMMDYFENVKDPKLKGLVRRTYYRFQNCLQKKLATRNAERKSKKQLGFQYLEPYWLTNSVHI